MARGLVSSEGINARSFPCINGSSAELTRGRPVMRQPIHNWKGEVVYAKHGAALGEFAGILSADLEYNGVADVSSSKLKIEGKVRATVYVDTASNYVKGCNLLPAWDSTNGSYLKYCPFNTGIVLLDDWTGKTNSTLYKVENGAGANVFIGVGAGYYNGILHYYWEDALATDADYYKAAQATSASVETTVTSFLNSGTPDHPRNITITPGGTTADVPAGDVVVTGTDVNGDTITENITFAANASTVTVGSKAFATITSVVFPIQDGAAATYDIGIGDKLGLGRCFPDNPVAVETRLGGTKEGTAPTIATDVDDIESNTIDLNSALNATDVEAYLLAF